MAIEPEERLSFFGIFKAHCSNADLGPISLNWFEELTAEALPYNPKTEEESEYKTHCSNKEGFKTPKRKSLTCSQLASTPRIFKDLQLTSPPFSSPINELMQSRSEAVNEKTEGKSQVITPSIARTKPDLPDDIFCSFSSLNESPAVFKDMYRTPLNDEHLYRTPRQYMKSGIRGSLICTPKFLSTVTPKCISESLGAQVDPEMSWSSSLATPPTLAATVIIAKGSDQMEERFLDNRTAYVVNSLFSKCKESTEKNDIMTPSKSQRESLNAVCDMKNQELENNEEGVSCDLDLFENGLSCATSLAWKKNIPNAVDDGDVHQIISDVLEGDEDLSQFFTSGNPASLREVKNASKVRKDSDDKASQEPFSVSEQGNKDVCSNKMKSQLDPSGKSLSQENATENVIQHEVTENKTDRELIQTSLTSEWSQLNLSCLDITQAEEMFKCIPSSSINVYSRKTEKIVVTTKDCPNISTLEVFSKVESGSAELIKILNINTSEIEISETENETKSELLKNVTLCLDHQNSTPMKKQMSKMSLDKNYVGSANKCLKKTYVHEHGFNTLENSKISGSYTIYSDSVPLSCNNDVHGVTWPRKAKNTAGSSLKGKDMLFSFKKQPKRFIYCVDDSSSLHKGNNSKGLWPSTYCALSHSRCTSYSTNIPDVKNCGQDVCGVSEDSVRLCSDTENYLEIQNINVVEMDDTFNKYKSFSDQKRYQELINDKLKTIVKQEQLGENTSANSSQVSKLVSKHKFVDVSSNTTGASIERKVLATAYHLAAKCVQMEASKKKILIHCPRKTLGRLNASIDSTNTFQTDTCADIDRQSLGGPSQAKECYDSVDCKPPMKMSDFHSSLHEISHEEKGQKRACCSKTTSEEETGDYHSVVDHVEELPSGGCKEITLPCFELSSYTCDGSVTLKAENIMDGNLISHGLQQNGFNMSSQTDNSEIMSMSLPPVDKDKQLCDHHESGYLNTKISAKANLVNEESMVRCPETIFSIPQKDGSTRDEKVILLNSFPRVQEFSKRDQRITAITRFPSKNIASDNTSSNSETYFNQNLHLRGLDEENTNKEDLYCLLSSNSYSLNTNFVGFKTASNKQIELSENSIRKGKVMFKEIEDQHFISKTDDEQVSNKENSNFLPTLNETLLNLQFGNFKTVSSKQLQVCENNVNKSKLFTEIEDQCLLALLQEQTESNSTLTRQDNEITHALAEKRLEANPSSLLQICYPEPKDFQSIITVTSAKETDLALQDLPVKYLAELSQSLTASQKAEITELSTILEETNSEFEFTQFRKKIDTVKNNISEKVEDLEGTQNLNNSEVWKEIDLDDSFNNEAPITRDKFCSERVDLNTYSEMYTSKNKEPICMENNNDENTEANVSHAGMPIVLSKPVDTFLSENSLTNFEGFRSASGKKINITSEVLLKAVKLFSDINDVEESPLLKSVSRCSNVMAAQNHTVSSPNNSVCQIRKHRYVSSTIKQSSSPNINNVKEAVHQLSASNKEKKRFCVSGGKDTIDVCKDQSSKSHTVLTVEPKQSSINHQHLSLKILNEFIPGKMSSECNFQEGPVSSAEYIRRAAKVMEECNVTVSDERPRDTDLWDAHQNDPKDNKSFNMQPCFQTAAGRKIAISTVSLEKAFHLLAEENFENKTNNSSFSGELVGNFLKKNNAETSPLAMECNTSQSKVSALEDMDSNDLKNKQTTHQKDHENRTKQVNFSIGFHTANGKKVTIADESLAKVKGLFAEETRVGINNQSTNEAGNLLQILNRTDENLNDTNESVSKMYGKTSTKYYGEIDLCEGYGDEKHSVCERSLNISEKRHNHRVYPATDFESEHTLALDAKSSIILKMPKRNIEISKKPCVVPFKEPFKGFQTGKGTLISVSESSLVKARKLLNEESLKHMPLKTNNVSKKAFSCSSAEDICMKCPSPVNTDLAFKVDEQSLDVSKSLCNEMVNFASNKSNSKIVCCINRVGDSECSLNCPIQTIATVFQNQAVDIDTVSKKTVSAFEGTAEPESSNINNLDIPSAGNVSASQKFVFGEGPITGKDQTDLKHSNTGPAVFSTAGGKTVNISHKALKQARQIFSDEKSIDTHIETKLQMNHIEVPACFKQPGNSKYLAQGHGKNADSSCWFSTEKGEKICIDENSLKYVRNVFADTSCEKIAKTEHQKFEKHIDKNHKCSTAITGCHSETLEKRPAFFSTASGKSVHLSNESLKKARQLFSEIDSNHSQEKQDCQGEELLGNKENKVSGEGNVLVNIKSEQQVSQDTNISMVGNSKHSFGFSTASGLQVLVSENSLQKAKAMFKEFDGIGNSNDCLESITCGTDANAGKSGDQELEKDISATINMETPHEEMYIQAGSCTTMEPSVMNKIPACVKNIKSKRPTSVFASNTAFSGKNQVLEDNYYQCVSKPQSKTDLTSLNISAEAMLKVHCATSNQIPENYLEKEAVESAKAFMEDSELMDAGLVYEKNKSCHSRTDDTRSGKRKRSEGTSFGTEDRRFAYIVPLKPTASTPCSIIEGRKEVVLLNFTDPDLAFKDFHAKSDSLQHQICNQSSKSSSALSCPFNKMTSAEIEKARKPHTFSKFSKTFVPPFRTNCKPPLHEKCNGETTSENVIINEDQINNINEQPARRADPYLCLKEKESLGKIYILEEHEVNDIDRIQMMADLSCARDLQEMRLGKKRKQNIWPQTGSLYEKKISATARIPLKVAVNGKHPSAYSKEQLYKYGFVHHSTAAISENAESFQFNCWDYFPKECLQFGHGIQLADRGLLIPTNNGKAGKEEFYRALCDTPGVDPKLITAAWVYNHYRWIVWKLAAMEVSFPEIFASRCLTPERVLLQLKYRYDVEVDKSQRSAIKKITERDDLAAKTLVLCVSKIVSSDAKLSHASSNKINPEPNKDITIEVTDGWYGINALLDPPLSVLLHRGRLFVGQKIIVHGAELIGSETACSPLEAPESLMLKISANSTRPACWHAKLGFHRDPRPFLLPLSSLFSEGGIVGCVDVIIQRVYPMQWMEKMSNGLYVFRNDRAEEREAEKHAIKQQKNLEVLFTKIQTEFEQSEAKSRTTEVRRRALTRQQIHALQDGAELFDAIQNESDPGFLENCLSENQLKALNNHRQMLNDKKQAEIQAEFKKAIDSDEQGQNGCSKRNVTPVWKLRVVDYGKQEKGKTFLLSIWRPLTEVCSLLKEGGRFRIYHLATSLCKGKLGTSDVQLTATKKTQYQQLQPSPEILAQIYSPRQILRFSDIMDPFFQPPCPEVDIVGYVVSISRKPGASPFVYLCDENHNLMAIKFWMDLSQLAIEDLIKPCTLIAAINLQWRQESNSAIRTVFAGDFSMISANPKESHLQEAFNRLKNSIQNVKSFCNDAQYKLIKLSQTNDARSPANYGLDPQTPNLKLRLNEGNKLWMPSPIIDSKYKKATSNPEQKSSIPCCLKTTPQNYYNDERELDTPKNRKKRRALDHLGRIPSPAPVTPIHVFVSPSLQKAFRPPRSSCGGQQNTMQLQAKDHNEVTVIPHKECNVSNTYPEGDWVADEELAMINTQALLSSLAKGKCNNSLGEGTSALSSTSSDNPVAKKDGHPLDTRGNTLDQAVQGTDTPQVQHSQSACSVLCQKKLQRRRKRKH
uniref:Breast cancer type 2 susceptibility protein isoform X3 n=1 Tax=Geotrypetes seraphini TaxID=260995 RepID=A0A6P8R2F2_GEOSA|nr:breast cancer type 2 susceptibility protein isoform X3 [Geotrypetes seraphini]